MGYIKKEGYVKMEATEKINEKMATEMLKGLKEFSSDMDWMDAKLDRLRKEYPNKYIAVNNRKIVGSDPNLQNLLRKLKRKKLNPGEIPVEFIAEKPPRLIL